MPIGLIALALGGFGIGLTEFGIVGLLPEIAEEFGVSESVAGLLVSGYALTVAIGAIALTAAVVRFDRKTVLVSLMVLFILGNLISAVSPDYATMLAGRIVAALCHGAFFGVGAVVATKMVKETQQASAIALMFGGLTVATVAGVPLGTFLGQQLGWRSTFWAITAIGVVTLIGVLVLVPTIEAATGSNLRQELAAFRKFQVWISLLVGILAFGAVVGAFTYIAFTLTEVSGFSPAAVPWLLVVFGVGAFVGNLVGGKLADRALTPTLVTLMALLAAVLALFALTAQNQIATVTGLLLLGAVGLGTAPGLQVRIMAFAPEAPTMASSANVAALNLGNAFGAWLGGVTIAAGYGFVSPLWVGASLAAAGLVVLLVGTAVMRTPAVATTEPDAAEQETPSAVPTSSH
jgi:DHA1 family inner membrane transport protein